MCRRVTCDHCGKPSYAGCGAHIEQVLGDVRPAERCNCREAKRTTAPKSEIEAKRYWWKR